MGFGLWFGLGLGFGGRFFCSGGGLGFLGLLLPGVDGGRVDGFEEGKDPLI